MMTVVFTLQDLNYAQNALIKLVKTDLPVKLGWNFGILYKELLAKQILYREQINNIAKKYGTPKEDDANVYMLSPENTEKAKAELNDLDNIEVKLDITKPIFSLEILEKADAKFTTAELISLEKFIQISD